MHSIKGECVIGAPSIATAKLQVRKKYQNPKKYQHPPLQRNGRVMDEREVYLISRSHIILAPVNMNTAGNFGRLLFQGHQQVTGVVIEACEGQGLEEPSTTALNTHQIHHQCPGSLEDL